MTSFGAVSGSRPTGELMAELRVRRGEHWADAIRKERNALLEDLK